MTTHILHDTADEILRRLEDARRRSLGEHTLSLTCRVCYSEFDDHGCPCGRCDWAPTDVVIVELTLWIQDHKRCEVATQLPE